MPKLCNITFWKTRVDSLIDLLIKACPYPFHQATIKLALSNVYQRLNESFPDHRSFNWTLGIWLNDWSYWEQRVEKVGKNYKSKSMLDWWFWGLKEMQNCVLRDLTSNGCTLKCDDLQSMTTWYKVSSFRQRPIIWFNYSKRSYQEMKEN